MPPIKRNGSSGLCIQKAAKSPASSPPVQIAEDTSCQPSVHLLVLDYIRYRCDRGVEAQDKTWQLPLDKTTTRALHDNASWAQVATRLRCLCVQKEKENRPELELISCGGEVNEDLARGTFARIFSDMVAETSLSWDQVVSIFTYAGFVAAQMCEAELATRCNLDELVDQTANFIITTMLPWILEQTSGWLSLLQSGDQNSCWADTPSQCLYKYVILLAAGVLIGFGFSQFTKSLSSTSCQGHGPAVMAETIAAKITKSASC